jgi:hypothetical protein
VFDGRTYDWNHHAERARAGGLAIDAMAYDAPTYYVLAPLYAAAAGTGDRRDAASERAHLGFLRATNVFYVASFYLLWIYGVLPRVLPSWRERSAAAMLILALPGYQKLAAMSHPDNLHVCLVTLLTFAWVRMPGVGTSAQAATTVPFSRHLQMALVAGLAGLSRPFSVAAVAVFGAFNLAHLALTTPARGAALARRAAAVALVTAVVAGSWLVLRGMVAGSWSATYRHGYIERFDRRGFDYASYLTTFHLRELVTTPNRKINRKDQANFERGEFPPGNRYANSFFTTLYSETWGDHWLYFSGRRGVEKKKWAKRILFVVALPLVPLLAWRIGRAAASVVRRAAARPLEAVFDPAAVLLLHLVAGAALFLYWQLGSALSPGKQSSIKFVYIASLYAPAVTLCFVAALRERFARPWAVYLAALFVAALPVAVFVPGPR